MLLNEVLNGVMTFTANGSLPSFVIKSKILKFEFFLRLWVKICQFVRLTAKFFAGRFTANGWLHWDPLGLFLITISHTDRLWKRLSSHALPLIHRCLGKTAGLFHRFAMLNTRIAGFLSEKWQEYFLNDDVSKVRCDER